MNTSRFTKLQQEAERRLSVDTTAERNQYNPRLENTRTVQFRNSPEVIGRSATPDLATHIWYTPRELGGIRDEIKTTLLALRSSGEHILSQDSENWSYRGIEDFSTAGGLSEKRRRIRNMILGVLDEQNNQRNMGITDPKGIQVQSSACSKSARAKALLLGKNDEIAARSIHFETQQSADVSCLHSSLSSLDSTDYSTEDSKIGCVGIFTAKLDLHGQRKNSSHARSA